MKKKENKPQQNLNCTKTQSIQNVVKGFQVKIFDVLCY